MAKEILNYNVITKHIDAYYNKNTYFKYKGKKYIMRYDKKNYRYTFQEYYPQEKEIQKFKNIQDMIIGARIDGKSIQEIWDDAELEVEYYKISLFDMYPAPSKLYDNNEIYIKAINKKYLKEVESGKNPICIDKLKNIDTPRFLSAFFGMLYLFVITPVYFLSEFKIFHISMFVFAMIYVFVLFARISFLKSIIMYNKSYRPIKDNLLTLCVFGIVNIWRVELWVGIVMSFLGIGTGRLIYKWYYRYRTKKNDELREKIKNGEIKI